MYHYVCNSINDILDHNRITCGREYEQDRKKLAALRREVKKSPKCTAQCLQALDAAEGRLKNEKWGTWDEIEEEFERRARSGYPLRPQQKDHYIETYFHGGC